MGFGIYAIGGVTPPQITTLIPVVIPATTTATNLVAANTNRVALSLVNETDKIVYMRAGTAATSPASASNKILEIPAKQRILLSGDDCPREALNIVWSAATTGNFEMVERQSV